MVEWYQTFPYRKEIIISNSYISGTHVDIPILVSTHGTDTDLQSKARNDGHDIIFVSGETRIHHELNCYNGGSGNFWVKIPSLTENSNNTIYMYYGDGIDHYDDAGYKASGTWDSGFVAVYHFNQDPSTHPGYPILDSTANQNHISGAYTPEVGGEDWAVTDLIKTFLGSSLNFVKGEWRYLTRPSNQSIYVQSFTVEAWERVNQDYAATWRTIFSIESPNAGQQDIWWGISDSDRLAVYINDDVAWYSDIIDQLEVDKWFHIATTFDNTNMRHYIDGKLAGGPEGHAAKVCYNGPFMIGKTNFYGYQYNYPGYLAEFRFHNVQRSTGWILTGYNSVSSNTNFLSIQTEESLSEDTAFSISGDGKLIFTGGTNQLQFITV